MPLKVVFFDFDCTLTVEHVFNCLAGLSSCSSPPFALTEAGQIARLQKYDADDEKPPGSFATWLFGGRARVDMLLDILSTLRDANIDCVIVTQGLVGVCRKLLDQLGLLTYILEVCGNLGDFYGVSAFDIRVDIGDDADYLGGPSCKLPGDKRSFISGFMMQRSLRYTEALFLDDTPTEVQEVTSSCQTMHVGPGGIGRAEYARLLADCKAKMSKSNSSRHMQKDHDYEEPRSPLQGRNFSETQQWPEVQQELDGPCQCQ